MGRRRNSSSRRSCRRRWRGDSDLAEQRAEVSEGRRLHQATQAALSYTGGGSVTEAEVGDQGAAYDVQVTTDDGTVVDLRLDSRFAVIGEENDDDEPESGAGDTG